MKDIQYPTALSKRYNREINIEEINEFEKNDDIYTCIYCKERMIPIFAIDKTPHFRHFDPQKQSDCYIRRQEEKRKLKIETIQKQQNNKTTDKNTKKRKGRYFFTIGETIETKPLPKTSPVFYTSQLNKKQAKSLLKTKFSYLSHRQRENLLSYAQTFTAIKINTIEDIIDYLQRSDIMDVVKVFEEILYPYDRTRKLIKEFNKCLIYTKYTSGE